MGLVGPQSQVLSGTYPGQVRVVAGFIVRQVS